MYLSKLFDSFLIDLDGVIYIGEKETYKSSETVDRLYKSGKKIIFLTNDPRRSPAEYADKLAKININTPPDNIVTSSTALSMHIKNNYNPASKTAFVIGSASLKDELREIGITIKSKNSDNNSDFVIVGGNNKVNYDDLKKATLCIRNGAKFFATNNDPYYPTPEGLVPATGALVAAIETASSEKASIVGKPNKIMFEVAKSKINSLHRCAVIGDRLDTDISGGKKAGMTTILSLTGSTDISELKKSRIKPDYVINDLTFLFKDSKLSKYYR